MFILSQPLTLGVQLTLGCSLLPMANSYHWLSPRYGQRRPTSHRFPSYGGAIISSMLSAKAMGATSSSWALSRHAVSPFLHSRDRPKCQSAVLYDHVLMEIFSNVEVLRFYQGWLDDAAVKYGGKQVRDKRCTVLRIADRVRFRPSPD